METFESIVTKKPRLDQEILSDSCAHSNNFQKHLSSFKDVTLCRVLNQVDQQKTIFLSAKVKDGSEDCVVILEKKPFDAKTIQNILSEETTLEQIFQNDIYGSYHGFINPKINALKVTVIHPATSRHLQKYSAQERHIVTETPELYRDIVLPFVQKQQLSLQWVYNILEHKAEVDRILYEDPDPDVGFILVPDLKWDGKNCEDLYISVIIHKKNLMSLRDLTAHNLPLLNNIRAKTQEVLKEKFDIPLDKARLFFHYQPSFYHLHLHVTSLKYEAPGIQCERGHLLDTVISNLNLLSDYYQRATLSYALTESDPLYVKILEQSSTCKS